MKLLYAKPIPKSLRTKPEENCSNDNLELRIHDSSTLKLTGSPVNLSRKIFQNGNCRKARNWDEEIFENDLNKSSHKENLTNLNIQHDNVRQRPNIIQLKSDFNTSAVRNNNNDAISIETKLSTLEKKLQNTAISDTLKRALNKPLPAGPAPRKPPRTFQHSPKLDEFLEKNISQLHMDKGFKKKVDSDLKKGVEKTSPKSSRGDAKYMLDKLENALKNNRIRFKRNNQKVDTSEEEFEDEKETSCKKAVASNLYTSNNNNAPGSASKFNLSCLPGGFNCTKTNSVYEQIAESKSSFFVDRKDEPVYATPFQFNSNDAIENPVEESANKSENVARKNSLYYMVSLLFFLIHYSLYQFGM